MDKKVILITGASGGMGRAMSDSFEKEGHLLALHANRNALGLSESDTIRHFRGDLSVEENCMRLINEVVDTFGRIDVLINNAGISRSSVSWKTTSENWKKTLAVNLDAPFFLCKHVIPHMRKENSGRIINISSVVAQTGFIGTVAYAASKSGLLGLTNTIAREVASHGITVNALALGYFNVGMISDVPPEMQKEIIEQIPVGKLGDPATVVRTIEWLMSDEAAYVTGQTINLNGGLHS